MRWGIIAALVLWCGVGLAEEPAADAPKEADPVQEKIEAATQRYYESIEKIEKDLCRQIDAMVESYADRGELEIVIELQNQKKQFLETGYPPAAPVFASNRRRAQIEITKAVNRMDRAYSDVVAQLTRQRDFTSATRMRDEWKEILATINPKIGDGFEAIRQAKLQKAGLAERNPEKAPVAPQIEAASTDQTVPDILKAINGGLSPEQDAFVRKLPYLTDGIAKALSRSSRHLYFDNLKTISGRHAEILLNGPTKHLVFYNPTVLTEDFLVVMGNCKKQNKMEVRSTPINVVHFRRLMANENLVFDYGLHLYTEAHIQKLLELGKKPSPLLRNDEYLQGDIDVALQIQPNGSDHYNVYVNGSKSLEADRVRGIEKLSCLLAFHDCNHFDLHLLPILKKRSDNGFPTLFVNCATPNGEFREKLEGYDIYFLTTNKHQPIHSQLKPFRDKWLEDKKKLTE